MNLTPIKSNMTELVLNEWKVLFSYQTAVAAQNRSTGNFYQTEKKWSRTTSRHINQWLRSYGDPGAQFMPQEYFDNLIAGVK